MVAAWRRGRPAAANDETSSGSAPVPALVVNFQEMSICPVKRMSAHAALAALGLPILSPGAGNGTIERLGCEGSHRAGLGAKVVLSAPGLTSNQRL
jgi:hypothetical protein